MDSLKKYRILCFGDSLTWGFDPKEKIRMSDENRYTAQLQSMLGDEYMVIEEGQNGRTIATDDPAEGEKNGLKYIVPCMETHNPIDLITVMLGSNDLKKKFGYSSMDIAGEMQIMLEKIQTYNTFRMNGRMKVLLIAPPAVAKSALDPWLSECFDLENASRVARELPDWYKQLSEMYNLEFLDANEVARVSEIDGIHIDGENQRKLAKAIYDKVCELRVK